jgi:cob(I)alamin adenosyltransferase
MGNRLTKIYTRTGDDGTTGLGDGTRVAKDDPRVEAYGAVDELNSLLGVILAVQGLPPDVSECLLEAQHQLFDLGGELCIPGHRMIAAQHVTRLEQALDKFNEKLPALKDFILPGGGPAAAACHVARAVARRAERRVWTLVRNPGAAPLNEEAAKYLNRLSDLLFVVARVLARHESGQEVLWRHERKR